MNNVTLFWAGFGIGAFIILIILLIISLIISYLESK
jgi:hypothetical protein